ncbi:MAG: iron-sulfur cluster assembly accessory protein [Deltaproteobacteria bacterium]|nr:MAG: iron-sulfur cluster assembly accessory protein [Deltaproteobacteria bacterium]
MRQHAVRSPLRRGVRPHSGRRAGSSPAAGNGRAPSGERPLAMGPMRLSLTDRAAKAVLVRAKDAEVQGWLLRIAVVGGGCNGLTYDLYFVESARPDDAVVDVQGLRIAVDPISVPLLDGTIIDLPRGPGFRFDNPQARSTCSCGASFET